MTPCSPRNSQAAEDGRANPGTSLRLWHLNSQQREQLFYILFARSPTDSNADNRMISICLFPDAETDMSGQRRKTAVFKHHKQLIALRSHIKPISFLFQAGCNAVGHLDAVTGNLQIQSVRKQCIKLQAEQTPFAKSTPRCLMIVLNCFTKPGRGITTASPNKAPTLVPPI